MGVLTCPLGFIAASTSKLSSHKSSGTGSARAGGGDDVLTDPGVDTPPDPDTDFDPDPGDDTAAAALNNSDKLPTPLKGDVLRLFLSRPPPPPPPPRARSLSIEDAGNIRRFFGEEGVEFRKMALTLTLALAMVLALVQALMLFAYVLIALL